MIYGTSYLLKKYKSSSLRTEIFHCSKDTVDAECNSVPILDKDMTKPTDTVLSKEQDENIITMIKQVLKNTECPEHFLHQSHLAM
jgi:hypothetical protein